MLMVSDYGNAVEGVKTEVRVYVDKETNEPYCYVTLKMKNIPQNLHRSTQVPLADLPEYLTVVFKSFQMSGIKKEMEDLDRQIGVLENERQNLHQEVEALRSAKARLRVEQMRVQFDK